MPARAFLRQLIAALVLAFAAAGVAAQGGAWPAKPIRLIVPFPPGAGTDTVARLVANRLGEALGTTIVVDNRAGAGGAIGAAEAARAEPDGHTLLFVASPFTTVAAFPNAGYDPLRQFTPVAPIAAGPLAFVVNGALPVRTMREFIAYAKAHPGELNYGSAGNGGINHLALELLKLRTQVDIVHVPYKGIAPATMDLLSGQIQMMTASIPATLPYLAQQKLRILAVTGSRRVALLPDVPAWSEQGVADADVSNYWGIVAPAGTPRAIVERINAETVRLLGQAEMRERLEKEGAELHPGPPERLGVLLRTDLERWKKLVDTARLKLE